MAHPPGPSHPRPVAPPALVVVPATALKPGPKASQGPVAVARAAPAKPSPRRREPFLSNDLAVRVVATLALATLALTLRLRDPLSSEIIGAEDPYLFMARTWDLVQGRGVDDYPVGFMLLLAPFTLGGPDTFARVARFLPPLFGVAAVLGTYVLASRHMRPVAAIAAGLLLASMPEHVVRTNLLFPTALILALLPLMFHLLLRLEAGHAKAALPFAGLMLFLLLTHPWFVALALPALLLFGLVRVRNFARLVPRRVAESPATARPARPWVPAAALGSVAVALLFVWAFSAWLPTFAWAGRAFDRFGELVRDPSSLEPLPLHVDLTYMLTWPAVVLAVGGALVALVRRRALDVLALTWTVALLPLVLVDWFDVWYIPHRTVAFMAIGFALLSGAAVSALVDGAAALGQVVRRRARTGDGVPRPFLPEPGTPRPAGAQPGARYAVGLGSTPGRHLVAVAALVVVAVLAVPSGFATHHWYRIYDEDDYLAWEEVAARDPGLVVTGDWRAKAGYRAMTGNEVLLDPDFFWNPDRRTMLVERHPDLVVLVDDHTKKNQTMEFVHEGWHLVGRWGVNEAYVRD